MGGGHSEKDSAPIPTDLKLVNEKREILKKGQEKGEEECWTGLKDRKREIKVGMEKENEWIGVARQENKQNSD